MSKVVTIENAAMERQERQDTKPQDRYADRRKFNFCHRCGSQDGMQAVHREILMEMTDIELSWLTWYDDGSDEHLHYPCPICNRDGAVPGYMKLVEGILSVRIWCSDNEPAADPMAPDYAALAESEPVLASLDSRESAGLEK